MKTGYWTTGLKKYATPLTVVFVILSIALLTSAAYYLRLIRLRHEHDMRVQDFDNQKYALDQHADRQAY